MPWAVRKGGGDCAADKFAVVNKQTGRTMGCHDSKASANKQLAALNANVDETAGGAMHETLTEARPTAGARAVKGKPGRFLIQLITPGWGTSGYYAPDVLEAAAKAKVFPAGTHMYIDHPTGTEQIDRPERTLRDLAASLAEDAYWDGSALVAEANVFERDRAPLAEMADVIGVSIRANAEVDHGEAEGRRGTIVGRLVEAISADFVTHAGRGGRIVQVMESAPPAQVVAKAVSRGVSEATANELRERLQEALKEAYGAEKSWIWVRDFDPSAGLVWYEHETPDQCATFQHGYTVADDGAVSLTGEPSEVRSETKYVPVTDPAGQTTTTESQGGTMAKIEIEESEHKRLVDEAGRVSALEAERDAAVKERDAAKAEADKSKAVAGSPRAVIEAQVKERDNQLAQLKARERGREVIGETLSDAWLTPSVVSRLTAELLEALPIVDHQLDEAALRDTATKARDKAEAEVAEALDAAGVGKPRGLGSLGGGGKPAGDNDERLKESFERLGLSEAASTIAAKGR